jgi:hypothetical protein
MGIGPISISIGQVANAEAGRQERRSRAVVGMADNSSKLTGRSRRGKATLSANEEG